MSFDLTLVWFVVFALGLALFVLATVAVVLAVRRFRQESSALDEQRVNQIEQSVDRFATDPSQKATLDYPENK
ncbi:MAG: hypothetical protein WD894_12550 [Pirellulales bacterium]